jgi:Tfp pilus assembly protein FimT
MQGVDRTEAGWALFELMVVPGAMATLIALSLPSLLGCVGAHSTWSPRCI